MNVDGVMLVNGVKKKNLKLEKKNTRIKKILSKYKSKGIYDCIVPVSGGKDGTYVASKLRDEWGLNPLTVTSRPPLEIDLGKKIFQNFLKFNFDHIHVTSNFEAMRILNKLGFIKKGCPYWGWNTSIFSTILRVATQHKINLIFYAEDGEIEYGGSTENKNVPTFDIKYAINNYFEGDYYEILKQSKLKRKRFILVFISKIEYKKIALTHWGYFEPWDLYRNYLFAKSKKIYLKINKQIWAHLQIFHKMIRHCFPFTLTLCILNLALEEQLRMQV